MKGQKISADAEQEILRLAADGMSQIEIGKAIGLSRATVGKVLRSRGISLSPGRRSDGAPLRSRDERDELIVELHDDGLTIKQIAKQVGCSATTAIKALKTDEPLEPPRLPILRREHRAVVNHIQGEPELAEPAKQGGPGTIKPGTTGIVWDSDSPETIRDKMYAAALQANWITKERAREIADNTYADLTMSR